MMIQNAVLPKISILGRPKRLENQSSPECSLGKEKVNRTDEGRNRHENAIHTRYKNFNGQRFHQSPILAGIRKKSKVTEECGNLFSKCVHIRTLEESDVVIRHGGANKRPSKLRILI